MSEEIKKGLLEDLKEKHAMFIAQRDQASVQFHQLVGAVAGLEVMIKEHEDKLKAELTAIANPGEM